MDQVNNMAPDHPRTQAIELQRDSHIQIKRSPCISKIYKNYHNSIHNPLYPPNKKVHINKNKVMFTIIGNVVTRELNETVGIVRRLTQYKPHKYGIAAIQYLNALEWIEQVKHLRAKYGVAAQCSDMQVAILTNDELLGDLNDLKKLAEDNIIFQLSLNYYKTGVEQFAKLVAKSGRSHAYMHIAKNDEYIGTLIFMLYTDLVPLTCENFLRLCSLTRGGYPGTLIHRIVKDGWIQCGGFDLQNTNLPCENHFVHHDKRGVLSMANKGRHCDNSTQFFVITEPAEWMDKKYVAFGQLVDGENTLQKIENSPTRYESPIDKITIMASGILNLYNQGIVPVNGLVNYLNLHIQNPKWIVDDLMKDFQEQLDNIIDFNTIYDQNRGSDESSVQEDPEKRSLQNIDEFPKSSNLTTDGGLNGLLVPKIDTENNSTILSKESEMSIVSESIDAKLYYYCLVDVPDPLERSSEFDIVKFNLGHLSLESDLEPDTLKVKPAKLKKRILITTSQNDSEDDVSMNSEDEDILNKFMRDHAERVSFCGDRLALVAKEKKRVTIQLKIPIYDKIGNEGYFEEDEAQSSNETSRSYDVPDMRPSRQIKHTSTGSINDKDSDEDDSKSDSDRPCHKKVYIADHLKKPPYKIRRRQTGFVRINQDDNEDFTLTNLTFTRRPTMVDYKPLMYIPPRNNYFLTRPSKQQSSDEEQYLHLEPSLKPFPEGIFQTFQPGKCPTYDYTNIPYIWQMPKPQGILPCSAEYNYARPSITVHEYKRRNKMLCLPVWSDLKLIGQVIEPRFSDTTVKTTPPDYDTSDDNINLYRPDVHLKGDTPTLVSWDSKSSLKTDSSIDSDCLRR